MSEGGGEREHRGKGVGGTSLTSSPLPTFKTPNIKEKGMGGTSLTSSLPQEAEACPLEVGAGRIRRGGEAWVWVWDLKVRVGHHVGGACGMWLDVVVCRAPEGGEAGG